MKKDNKDLAILILDELVERGLIEDCQDTDDTTEFDFQDAIEDILNRYQPFNKAE